MQFQTNLLEKDLLISHLLSMTLAFFVGVLIAACSVQNSWRVDAAATECAQFNPSNGHFEWREVSE
jgi:hypothetical protein